MKMSVNFKHEFLVMNALLFCEWDRLVEHIHDEGFSTSRSAVEVYATLFWNLESLEFTNVDHSFITFFLKYLVL